MLRYKNSLLERILLEKGNVAVDFPLFFSYINPRVGIDVQAELKSKADSACMGPNSIPPSGISHQFPLQRSAINRPSHSRRSITGPSSKSSQKSPSSSNGITKELPRIHGRRYSMTHAMSTKTSGIISQSPPKGRLHAPRRHSGLINSTSAPALKIITNNSRPGSRDSENGSTSAAHSAYYTSPFQTHIEQLGMLSHLLHFLDSVYPRSDLWF